MIVLKEQFAKRRRFICFEKKKFSAHHATYENLIEQFRFFPVKKIGQIVERTSEANSYLQLHRRFVCFGAAAAAAAAEELLRNLMERKHFAGNFYFTRSRVL